MAKQTRWAEWPNSAPMSYGLMVLVSIGPFLMSQNALRMFKLLEYTIVSVLKYMLYVANELREKTFTQ